MTAEILKFTPFQSAVDASFWQSLVNKKLNVLKLSNEQQPMHGHYTFGTSTLLPSLFSIPAEGLEPQEE